MTTVHQSKVSKKTPPITEAQAQNGCCLAWLTQKGQEGLGISVTMKPIGQSEKVQLLPDTQRTKRKNKVG
jgi:hypothetical protein